MGTGRQGDGEGATGRDSGSGGAVAGPIYVLGDADGLARVLSATNAGAEGTADRLLAWANALGALGPLGPEAPGSALRRHADASRRERGRDGALGLTELSDRELEMLSCDVSLGIMETDLLQYDTGAWVAHGAGDPWPGPALGALRESSGTRGFRSLIAAAAERHVRDDAARNGDDGNIASSTLVASDGRRCVRRVEKLAMSDSIAAVSDAYTAFRHELVFDEALPCAVGMEGGARAGTVAAFAPGRDGDAPFASDAVSAGLPMTAGMQGPWAVRVVSAYGLSYEEDGSVVVAETAVLDSDEEKGAAVRALRRSEDESIAEVNVFQGTGRLDRQGRQAWKLVMSFSKDGRNVSGISGMVGASARIGDYVSLG